jgi:hypothetical protein
VFEKICGTTHISLRRFGSFRMPLLKLDITEQP